MKAIMKTVQLSIKHLVKNDLIFTSIMFFIGFIVFFFELIF